jgi:hypothetical protein
VQRAKAEYIQDENMSDNAVHDQHPSLSLHATTASAAGLVSCSKHYPHSFAYYYFFAFFFHTFRHGFIVKQLPQMFKGGGDNRTAPHRNSSRKSMVAGVLQSPTIVEL